MATRDDEPDPDDRAAYDALRQRVYGPGATEEDRERLRSATRAAAPARTAPPPDLQGREPVAGAAEAEVPPPRATSGNGARPRRGRLLLVGAALVVAVCGAVIGVRAGTAASGPVPARATALPVTGEERAEFVDDLLAGGAAGLSAYLVTHVSPPALRTATRFDTVERQGVGSQTLRVGRPEDAGRGRATVLLVLASGGDATWRIERTTDEGDDAPVVARRGGRQEAGVPTTATFALPSSLRTVRLHVDVPPGVRWGVAVVFSD